uniref:Uncharacterized protein n=1 Tax=Arundo donax TaxID=35708 RepID=A0A0A9ENC8_ARUDO
MGGTHLSTCHGTRLLAEAVKAWKALKNKPPFHLHHHEETSSRLQCCHAQTVQISRASWLV